MYRMLPPVTEQMQTMHLQKPPRRKQREAHSSGIVVVVEKQA
jgi:hypothetical protein